MILAVKKNDAVTVCMGTGDMYCDMSEKDMTLKDNLPFFKVRGEDCFVFGKVANYSFDALRHCNDIFKGITDGNSIITNVVPQMKDIFSTLEIMVDKDKWAGSLIIVKGNKIFTITNQFTVSESDDYAVLFYREEAAEGAVEQCDDLSGEETVLFVARLMSRLHDCNLFPVVTFDSKSKKTKTYLR